MESRRRFIQASAVAAAAARSVLGANDRVQMAIIGAGNRGTQVHAGFMKHSDQVFVAACDVARNRLDQFVTKAGKMDTATDYRKILERKDVDAVLISTPDHWHAPIMIAAVEAGKDVYVEKPISNSIEGAQKMVEAGHKHNRVIQVGLQQRSWGHFQEASKFVMDGYIGRVTACHTVFSNYMPVPEVSPAEAAPQDLDWDMFQGPADKRPYAPNRQRRWRAYYAYGGGMITDWGVHLVDVAHWYMRADNKAPQLTGASSGYYGVANPDKEQTPNTFVINWQYDDFVMTFGNAELPNFAEDNFPLWGTYFFGEKGAVLVNRTGYKVIPKRATAMAPPPQQAGRGSGAAQAGMPQTGPAGPPIEAKNYINPLGNAADATPDHVRNFLDCVKSRKQPVANIDVGFHSTLPCLLGLLAIRTGKQYAWEGNGPKAV